MVFSVSLTDNDVGTDLGLGIDQCSFKSKKLLAIGDWRLAISTCRPLDGTCLQITKQIGGLGDPGGKIRSTLGEIYFAPTRRFQTKRQAESAADLRVDRLDAVHGEIENIINIDTIMISDRTPGFGSTMLTYKPFLHSRY